MTILDKSGSTSEVTRAFCSWPDWVPFLLCLPLEKTDSVVAGLCRRASGFLQRQAIWDVSWTICWYRVWVFIDGFAGVYVLVLFSRQTQEFYFKDWDCLSFR